MSGLEELLTGRTLVKRYRIGEVIGRGGFAAVYRAEDERLGRPVAVKVITASGPPPSFAEKHRKRFEREARAAASLPQHPNVVTVHDFGVDPVLGLDFLVMEFLHGEDLATRLARSGRPPLEDAVCILRDATAGIAVGHRAGIVHGDVKPGNIFLAETAGTGPFRVCILDFGIARVLDADQTLTGVPAEGTPLSPAYASPEQSRGVRDLAPGSDVFSLGVVGYQLLTGEKPFRSPRDADPSGWVPARSIRDLNPEVPPWLEAVVLRALAYAPEDRFADADDLATALASPEGAGATVLGATAAPAVTPVAWDSDDRTAYQPTANPAPARESMGDPTAYQPAPGPVPARGRRQIVYGEPPAKSRSAASAFLLILGLAGAAAGGWWLLSDRGEALPPDSAAIADIDEIADELEDATREGRAETPGPADQPGDGAGAIGDAGEGGAPIPALLPLTDSFAPGPPAIGSPQVVDSAVVDSAVVDSAVVDSAVVDSGGSPTADTDSAPLVVDSTLPPPRILGVPVDSTH